MAKLVILHTNDTHSNIDPFPANHPKFPNQGGVAARAKLIKQIRQEEEWVLLLDAGDLFQGTPYFNRFHGVLEMKVMAEMGYDLATLGNHDFDIGIAGFMAAAAHANFEFVNANYDFGQTPMAAYIKPYKIIQKGPYRIGIFGVGVDLNGLVPAANFEGISMLDPYESSKKVIRELQASQCNLIICLSHLGYQYEDPQTPSDLVLASQVDGIDLILGGHTHTFLEQATRIKSPNGNEVVIHQVGWAGVRLGRIDIEAQQVQCQHLRIEKN
ncbi:MAG: hypothetical protein RLZZ301_1518 [Bacteroidota bacterium]